MKASEALKKLNKDILACPRCATGTCDECQLRMVMYDALREKAEREEQERPKVTLAQMVEACSYASGLACGPHVEWLDLAADTLRKLDEEGGKLLAEARPGERHTIDSLGGWMCSAINLLSSLGVKEKP